MEQRLSPYNEVYFSVSSLLGDAVYDELRKLEYEFVDNLTKANLFAKFNLGECQANCEKALVIKADIVDILQVDETLHALGSLGGAYVPPGKVDVEMVFIDGASGREIGRYMTYGDGRGTVSSGTNKAIEKVAKSMIEIIKRNY